jgi:hypothetical protein
LPGGGGNEPMMPGVDGIETTIHVVAAHGVDRPAALVGRTA